MSVKTEMTRTRGSLLSEPSNSMRRVQRAGRQAANTHARKGTPGRHPGRFQVANLVPSKRCSRMPLIGLVRLRRALEGAIPSFDPIRVGFVPAGCWATRKRRQAGNGLMTCYLAKAGARPARGTYRKGATRTAHVG
jgi:hypothetical protein